MIPDKVVMCIRANKGNVLFGYKKKKCIQCKKQVWISKGTVISVEKGLYPNVYACIDCISKELKQDGSKNG